MAHVAKYPRSSIGRLCHHYERKKDEYGEYIRFGNQDINTSRCHLNYNLAAFHPEGLISFIQNRCKEVKCLNRKDVNVLCSWVVTQPRDLPEKNSQRFFEETYSFLEKRYGKENVISAYVHLDETTPHLHFAFVPVVSDRKTGQPKVSAKECISKKELQVFHTELDRHLTADFGYSVGILNDATKDGNRSIEELKRGTAIAKLEMVSLQASEASKTVEKAKENLSKIKKEIDAFWDSFESLQAFIGSNSEIDKMGKKSLIGNSVVYSAEEDLRIKSAVKNSRAVHSELQRYKTLLEQYERRIDSQQEETSKLQQEVWSKESTLRWYASILESNPALMDAFHKQGCSLKEQEEARRQRDSAWDEYDLE